MISTTVSITLAELDRHDACFRSGGRELLSAISTMQWGQDTGEVTVPDWTPLHSVWLAVAYPDHAAWLRGERVVPQVNLCEANLDSANLSGADFSGANLTAANLDRARLYRANLSYANLRGANLRGANLSGADLRGAWRLSSDKAIDGWVVVDGWLRRAA